MKVTLIQATPNPVETIAQIASICYDSEPDNPMGLVKHLYRNGHHSVFEHIYFTFKVEGISRACSHQIVRHRHCSFTQRSQRYCSEDGFGFVIPDSVDAGRFVNDMEDIGDWYEEYQANGVPNEDARYVLPNACETSMYISCNLRELIHMANERKCYRAQWEIRELVTKMCDLVDSRLQFMLVAKCQSGRIICPSPCKRRKEEMKK
jgi:thymidylate synthase (FAD)